MRESAERGEGVSAAARFSSSPRARSLLLSLNKLTALPPSSMAWISSGLKVAIVTPLHRWLNWRLDSGREKGVERERER